MYDVADLINELKKNIENNGQICISCDLSYVGVTQRCILSVSEFDINIKDNMFYIEGSEGYLLKLNNSFAVEKVNEQAYCIHTLPMDIYIDIVN